MKKKIFYWSPFLSPIATSRAVINSASSLIKFSQNYESSILNFFGEFNLYKEEIQDFGEMVLNGRKTSNATLADGLKIINLTEAIFNSALKGRLVKVPI